MLIQKKKFWIIILILTMIIASSITVISSFFVHSVDHTNSTEIQDTTTTPNVEEYVNVHSFNIDKTDYNLCLGKPNVEISCNILPINADYSLTIESNNENVCTVDDNFIVPVGVGNASISILCTDETDTMFSKILNVSVQEVVSQINTTVTSSEINRHEIIIEMDKKFNCENLSVTTNNQEDLLIMDSFKSTTENKFFIDCKLNNLLSADLIIAYENNFDNYNDTIEKMITVSQDKSYFDYSVDREKINNQYELYLYNENYHNEANTDGFYNSATITINQGFEISNANYTLFCNGNNFQINGMVINALLEGEGTVEFYIGDLLLDYFSVTNQSISVQSAYSSQSEYNLTVGEIININPIVILPVYALYDISFSCDTSYCDCFTIQSGELTANQSIMNAQVTINVGCYSYEIILNIEEDVKYVIELRDRFNVEIDDQINVTTTFLRIAYYFKEGNEYIENYEINVSCLNLVANIDITVVEENIEFSSLSCGEYEIQICLKDNGEILKNFIINVT